MTPQEKVIELREKFMFILLAANAGEIDKATMKCVDVVVNEILDAPWWEYTYAFYKQVKEENK